MKLRYSLVLTQKKMTKKSSFLWEQRESNPRPSACKADALNQLSYAPFDFPFLSDRECKDISIFLFCKKILVFFKKFYRFGNNKCTSPNKQVVSLPVNLFKTDYCTLYSRANLPLQPYRHTLSGQNICF